MGVSAADWVVRADHREGLPFILRHGAEALSARFFFRGKDSQWARVESKFEVEAPGRYAVRGRVAPLAMVLSGRVIADDAHELRLIFDFDATQSTPEAAGGFVFRFDLQNFAAELGEPRLLPGNRGWAWGRLGGPSFEMRFDPALESLNFSGGTKSELRGLVYRAGIERGSRRQAVILRASGAVALGSSVSERYGTERASTWPIAEMDWRQLPIDLSFMNDGERPAGRRGFVRVEGNQLVFDDGSPARFWGTSLTAAALFQTSAAGVVEQARRLAKAGINLVRIHHHDSHWVVPNIFGDADAVGTEQLSVAMLEKLDWWIKCFKDEGIYIWLDLHVGRRIRAADRIELFDEMRKGQASADVRGYLFVNPSVQLAFRRFNERYLSHRNRHTGLRYREDPAIVGYLISNENDLTNHFANLFLPEKKVPGHTALFMQRAQEFAAKHQHSVGLIARTWEHGPAKLFLNELEWSVYRELARHLRKHGIRSPIATTSMWGFNPMSSLPALTAGDLVDVHAYGTTGELERNPLYAANFMHWAAAAQVAGLPLTVSEWNLSPFPSPDRHAAAIYVASVARLQGWSAVMQYAYSQVAMDEPEGASNWHAFNDPALIASLPAAALLFRQGHIRESETVYAYAPTAEQLFHNRTSPAESVALRTAAERGKLVVVLPRVPELHWMKGGTVPDGAYRFSDLDRPFLPTWATQSVSDTGELRRDWSRGVFTVDSRRTQAAAGWIGGTQIRLADVTIDSETPSATIVVQALDGKPIRASRRVLITVAPVAVPHLPDPRHFRSEPVRAKVRIRAPDGLVLFAWGFASGKPRQVPASYRAGAYEIDLGMSPGITALTLQ